MLKVLLYLIAIYLIFLLFLYLVQRQLIYFPESFAPSPAEAGVPEMQVVELQTSDGLILKAWYRRPTNPLLPTLVYFHSNAGHIGYRAGIVKPFLNEGYGVLLLTYRGYSGNPGKPYEEGLYTDARAAMEFLKREGFVDQRTVLYGNSIGAAVAIQIATEYPVGAIVLQSPFTSLADVGQYHYPLFPVKWFVKDKFNSMTKREGIDVPIFILHGNDDRIIPPMFSRQLFEALPEPKHIEYIPNRGHNDLFEPELVIRFINEQVIENQE
ncbi:MAG: hypothetical protein K940chlam7_01978 [Chlamydiae bacterium]|nr:hypothetical protein [Chlamydiota bacterium]